MSPYPTVVQVVRVQYKEAMYLRWHTCWHGKSENQVMCWSGAHFCCSLHATLPGADRRICQADARHPSVLTAESLKEGNVVEEAPHCMNK